MALRRLQASSNDPNTPAMFIDDVTGVIYRGTAACGGNGTLRVVTVELPVDGNTQDFTLPVVPLLLLLYWGGNYQHVGDDYTLSGVNLHMLQVPGAQSNLVAVAFY